jgi:radical SAM superfamily enzyme YgiQ (UPF0313 family)
MGKKLLLVNPVNPRRVGLTGRITSRFPPLGLGIVAALTPSDWEVELIDENFEPFVVRDADLVGLTAFTSSVTRAYQIARAYREKGIPTVLGGIHASMLPEEAVQYVDTVVIGEAESVWGKVIADFEAGHLQRTYRGEQIDLKDMPKARHDLFHPDYIFGCVQTARGCPMDCEFCSVTAFNGHRYRQRPVEDVLDELEALPQKAIFFVDDNIYGYGPHAAERAGTLFQGMLDRGIKKDWLCLASLNFADDEEVLELAGKSGCRVAFVGLEAENSAALDEVNKQLNLHRGVASYEEAFRRFHRHGIAVLGGFIYGLDSDTPADLRRRTEYIVSTGVDAFQLTMLTPLPGTRLFHTLRDQGRLLYTNFPADWDHYDMLEVTHKPGSMPPEQLAVVGRHCGRQVYGRRSIWGKFAKTWWATRSLTTALWAYHTNMVYRAVLLGVDGSHGKGGRAHAGQRQLGIRVQEERRLG